MEAWLIAAMFLFGSLTGCASVRDTHGNVGTPEDGKLKVVTTLFPYYDFARQIAGDVVDLSMVIPAGQDSHSFEPTPADIRLIQNADLLICNGGTMEQWVTQVLGSLDAPDLKVITMMDYVDVVQEEIVEGMEDSGDRKHDVEGAKKTGLSVVGVLYGYGSREELQDAGADYLCETPGEVAELLRSLAFADGNSLN